MGGSQCSAATYLDPMQPKAFKNIATTHGGTSPDEATTYVRRLAADKRYVRDVD